MRLWLISAILCLVCAAPAQNSPSQPSPEYKTLVKQFDYDAKAPLDLREIIIENRDGVTVRDVSYASPKGGRVTAYLVAPDTPGPHPAVVFGHWGAGNRTEFLPEAILYAKAGAVSLMIDDPWVRPAPWHVPLSEGIDRPEHNRDVQIQAVVDLRRGIDMLASRQGIDPKRIAYVGHSFGAQWGAILSAIDKRVKTVVLMAGAGSAADIFLTAPGQKIPPEKLERYLAVLGSLDAVRYVPHSKVPLLFQFARYERFFSKESMDRYYEAAEPPKKELWYDSGHELNDPQALRDRYEWLRKYIDLGELKELPASR